MKEELIRIENGRFSYREEKCSFDIALCKGQCIGVFSNEHLITGAAYSGIFCRKTAVRGGRFFAEGKRVSPSAMSRWINQNCLMIDGEQLFSKELTARDFIIAVHGTAGKVLLRKAAEDLESAAALTMKKNMQIDFAWDRRLGELGILDYYRLAVYKAWFQASKVIVLNRMTEVLRQQDMTALMDCMAFVLENGMAVLLLDIDEQFLFRYADRIDITKNRKTCFHLYPEEYDDRIYEILGWKSRSHPLAEEPQIQLQAGTEEVLRFDHIRFAEDREYIFSLRRGEIYLLEDETYTISTELREWLLEKKDWISGECYLQGKNCQAKDIGKMLGREIGLITERPDSIHEGILFDELSAVDNLSIFLGAKARRKFLDKNIEKTIMNEAAEFFQREKMLLPVKKWTMEERLRFCYYKWYLLNPALLICFFPFAGQESVHHEMIMEMMVRCARRGMALLIVSSGIDAICQKTGNRQFLQRLHKIEGPENQG